jgi:ATP-dependent DNA ligase
LVTTRLALSLPGRVLAGLTASQLASKSVCKLGLEGIVSKKLDAPYKSGPKKGVVKSQKSEGARCYSRY